MVLSVVFPGHLMMTMNLRSFKFLEKLGKWKNWSYQTCLHKTWNSWASLSGKQKAARWWRATLDICIHTWIERQTEKGILAPVSWFLCGVIVLYVCVSMAINQYCSGVWCNNASVFTQKRMSLPPAFCSTEAKDRSLVSSRRTQRKTLNCKIM